MACRTGSHATGTTTSLAPLGDGGIVAGMAFIGIIEADDADGDLKAIYGQAERRAGRVFNVLKIMSRSPRALRASMDMYLAVMFGASDLSRAQREMLAVVVSAANHCHY